MIWIGMMVALCLQGMAQTNKTTIVKQTASKQTTTTKKPSTTTTKTKEDKGELLILVQRYEFFS